VYIQIRIKQKMAGKAADWMQDHALQWIDAPPLNKVDTHHHYVPSFYAKGKFLFKKIFE